MSWTLIEHQALSSSAASVTLGSGGTIPQTYKTLILVVSPRNTGTAYYTSLTIKPNGASVTGRRVGYEAGSAYSDTTAVGYQPSGNATANTFGSTTITIPNYASTTTYKAISVDSVAEDNSANNTGGDLVAMIYSANTAITSIDLTANFAANTTFTLYGLA